MTTVYAIAMIAVAAVCTFATRVAPFLLFAVLFLILPTAFLVVGAFRDADGHFTFGNLRELFSPTILSAY